MFFNSLPTLKSGNVPLIMLACHALDDGHPFAWTRFFPGTKVPCVQTKDLVTVPADKPISFDLWLPTPQVMLSAQPQRRLFVAWTIDMNPGPVDPNLNDGGGYLQTMMDKVASPRFQVLGTSNPSRPTGSEFSFSSGTSHHVTLTSFTPLVDAEVGGAVTEISSIKAPANVTGGSRDMLCYLRVQAPYVYPPPGYRPGTMRFYLKGLAVDQW